MNKYNVYTNDLVQLLLCESVNLCVDCLIAIFVSRDTHIHTHTHTYTHI